MIVAIKIMVIENGLLVTQILVTQYVGNQNFGNGKNCGDHKMWQQKNCGNWKQWLGCKWDFMSHTHPLGWLLIRCLF